MQLFPPANQIPDSVCVRVCVGNCCSVTRCGRLVILLLYLRVPDNKSQSTSARDAHTPSTLCLEHTEQTE